MTKDESCPTRLLSDTPAETDSFGSHERVARSIAEVVQTESGGKAIGLEGGWGAGKSTIVNLISQKLSQAKKSAHKIAVFDMWSHQGDPLRRTFLENLIKSVLEFGWVDKEKWNRRIAELSKRRREDTTRLVPRLTNAGAGFAFTLLAIPVGSALIGAGLSILGSKDGSTPLGTALLPSGLIVALAPAIYFGVVIGIRVWKSACGGKRSEEGKGLSELPALVTGQASTESRTVMTETPDPTSVEFESIFRDLLDEALEQETCKLLIVVDNLDRVDPSDALSIWSTLQTFLAHRDYQRPDWIDRLWVLIPYDANAIVRLWDGLGSDATKPANSSLATSFLDKTFQLRFRVPPLLLSNWREFLQEALQQALPNHRETDYHGVYRAFAAKGGLERSAPTPRDIKIFVNQIGALHREWQDQFPLSHLACYVLFQKDHKDVREALLSNSDFELLNRNIGQEWRGIIAALHFGVPVEEARQLLLRGPIQVALASGDGKALSDLEATHQAGFWSVLEDTVPAGAEDWNSLAPADLAKAANAIANSRIFDHSAARPEEAAIRSTIQTAAVAVQAWNPFDEATVAGIVAMNALVGNSEEMVSRLLVSVSNTVVEDPEGSAGAEAVSPGVWMNSAFTLIRGLVQLGLNEKIRNGIKAPLSAQQWLDVSNDAAKNDPEGQLFQYIELVSIEAIDELLDQQIANSLIEEGTFNAVQNAMATRSRSAMTAVPNQAFSRLQSGDSFPGDQLVYLLKVLRVSKLASLIDGDEYRAFAESGHYLHHLYYAASESHPEAVAECMFGYLQAVPEGCEPSHVGNSSDGYQTLTQLLQDPESVPGAVRHFITLAKAALQLADVFEMAARDGPVPPFVAQVLKTLITAKDVSKPVALVKEHWDTIREVLREGGEGTESLDTFLQGLPGLDRLITDIVDDAFNVDDSGLYVALLRSSASTNLVTWCANGLSSVSLDTWSEEITSQGDLIDPVAELKTRGASIVLGATYLDALVEYAEGVAGGSVSLLKDQNWSNLLSLLDADRHELFPRRVYEILKATDGGASAEFFAIFGGMLSNRKILTNEPRLIDQVCRPILDSDNAEGLAWVANIADSEPELLTNHDDRAAANDFIDRIQQRLVDAQEGDPTLPDLKRIGVVLGISHRGIRHRIGDASQKRRID